MLHAKERYIKHLVPRQKEAGSFTFMRPPTVDWLHDSFNKHHMRRPRTPEERVKNKFDGVVFTDCPSKYKVNKAIHTLKRHAMEPAINGINGLIDGRTTAIFYYAALILDHYDTGASEYKISPRLRCDIHRVLVIAARGMEKDHERRIEVNAGILDTLIDTLADAHAERRVLTADWKSYVDARTNNFPYEKDK